MAIVVVGFAMLWDSMVLKQRKISSGKVVTLPFSKNKEISLKGDYIIINKEGQTTVFSSSCTHLGCKINQHTDSQLLCPCHGSTFDLKGNATKGPAVKPLKSLAFEINDVTAEITIMV